MVLFAVLMMLIMICTPAVIPAAEGVKAVTAKPVSTGGNIITATSGFQPVPSLLPDGTYGMVKNQKWYVGAGTSVSDETTLKMNTKGFAKAKKKGSADIILNGVTKKVVINQPFLSAKKVALGVGESISVSLNGLPEGQKVSWITGNENVAQVVWGRIFATGRGKTTVCAVSGGRKYKVSVKVNDKKGTTYLMNVPAGKGVKIRIPSSAGRQWTTSSDKVILSKGKVRAGETGCFTVSSNDGYKIKIHSNDPALDTSGGLSFGGKKNHYVISLRPGERYALNFISNHEKPAWKSKEPHVAVADGYGVIYAVNPGKTKLSTKTAGQKVTVLVTVGNDSTLTESSRTVKKEMVDAINGNEGVSVEYDPLTGDEKESYSSGEGGAGIGSEGEDDKGKKEDEKGSGNSAEPGNADDPGKPSNEGDPGSKEDPGNTVDQGNSGDKGKTEDPGSKTDPGKTEDPGKKDGPEKKLTCTIFFIANGGTCEIEKKEVTANSPLGELPIPEREHYSCTGWFTEAEGGEKITEDTAPKEGNLILYAHWAKEKYNLNFDPNGGKSSVLVRALDYGDPFGTLPEAEKKGYGFEGWYTALTDGKRVNEDTPICGPTTVYALWTPKKYTVSFNGNGMEVNETRTVTFDSPYGKLPKPEMTGYSFKGWFTDVSVGTEVKAEDMVSEDKDQTLYARWEANKYKVKFDGAGGTSKPSEAEVTFASTYSALPQAEREGHTFNGWFTEKSGGTKVFDYTRVSVPSDHTLFAHWTPNQYRITLDAAGGNPAKTEKNVTYGTKYGELKAPSRAGYSFKGWFSAKSGGEEIKANSLFKEAKAKTLYARWTPNTYTVKFDGNGGTPGQASKTVTYASTYGTLQNATRKGYAFEGWYTAKTGGTKIISSSTVNITEVQTLYAHWTANTYTVTLNYSGEKIYGKESDSKKVTFGSAYGNLAKPAKKGYTFDGWYTAKTGGTLVTNTTTVTEAGDHTLYARWTLYCYDVEWSGGPLAVLGGFLGEQEHCSYETRGHKKIVYTTPEGREALCNPFQDNGIIHIKPGSKIYFMLVAGDPIGENNKEYLKSKVSLYPADGNKKIAEKTDSGWNWVSLAYTPAGHIRLKRKSDRWIDMKEADSKGKVKDYLTYRNSVWSLEVL